MRVLITGVTGFLGSHLAKFLIENGHSVIGLKRKTSSLERLSPVADKLDLRDIEDGFEDFNSEVDAIIHTATCYGNRGESVSDVLSANVIFPLSLIEALKNNEKLVFLNAGTFFCKAKENYSYLKNYIRSKNIFHDIAKDYCQDNGIFFVNISLEHMYGPGDAENKFVSMMLRKIVCNEKSVAITDGNQLRDFIHVFDVISAFENILVYAKKNADAEEKYINFELGTGTAISVRDFIDTMHRLAESKTMLDYGALKYREGEIMHSEADIQCLVAKTGWHPRVNLIDGLGIMVSEMKAISGAVMNHKNSKMGNE